MQASWRLFRPGIEWPEEEAPEGGSSRIIKAATSQPDELAPRDRRGRRERGDFGFGRNQKRKRRRQRETRPSLSYLPPKRHEQTAPPTNEMPNTLERLPLVCGHYHRGSKCSCWLGGKARSSGALRRGKQTWNKQQQQQQQQARFSLLSPRNCFSFSSLVLLLMLLLLLLALLVLMSFTCSLAAAAAATKRHMTPPGRLAPSRGPLDSPNKTLGRISGRTAVPAPIREIITTELGEGGGDTQQTTASSQAEDVLGSKFYRQSSVQRRLAASFEAVAAVAKEQRRRRSMTSDSLGHLGSSGRVEANKTTIKWSLDKLQGTSHGAVIGPAFAAAKLRRPMKRRAQDQSNGNEQTNVKGSLAALSGRKQDQASENIQEAFISYSAPLRLPLVLNSLSRPSMADNNDYQQTTELTATTTTTAAFVTSDNEFHSSDKIASRHKRALEQREPKVNSSGLLEGEKANFANSQAGPDWTLGSVDSSGYSNLDPAMAENDLNQTDFLLVPVCEQDNGQIIDENQDESAEGAEEEEMEEEDEEEEDEELMLLPARRHLLDPKQQQQQQNPIFPGASSRKESFGAAEQKVASRLHRAESLLQSQSLPASEAQSDELAAGRSQTTEHIMGHNGKDSSVGWSSSTLATSRTLRRKEPGEAPSDQQQQQQKQQQHHQQTNDDGDDDRKATTNKHQQGPFSAPSYLLTANQGMQMSAASPEELTGLRSLMDQSGNLPTQSVSDSTKSEHSFASQPSRKKRQGKGQPAIGESSASSLQTTNSFSQSNAELLGQDKKSPPDGGLPTATTTSTSTARTNSEGQGIWRREFAGGADDNALGSNEKKITTSTSTAIRVVRQEQKAFNDNRLMMLRLNDMISKSSEPFWLQMGLGNVSLLRRENGASTEGENETDLVSASEDEEEENAGDGASRALAAYDDRALSNHDGQGDGDGDKNVPVASQSGDYFNNGGPVIETSSGGDSNNNDDDAAAKDRPQVRPAAEEMDDLPTIDLSGKQNFATPASTTDAQFDNLTTIDPLTGATIDTITGLELDPETRTPFARWSTITIAILIGLCVLLTVLGNILVLLSFVYERAIRQPSNYFICSLALSDLSIGIVSMPLFAVYVLRGWRWTLGPFWCDIWLATDHTLCLVSIYTVLLITVDRFFSIRAPTRYREWRTKRRVIIMIIITWIVPFGIFFGTILSWDWISGGRELKEYECAAPFLKNPIFSTSLILFYFYSTLVIMFVLYAGIYKTARDLAKKSENKQKRMQLMMSMQQQQAEIIARYMGEPGHGGPEGSSNQPGGASGPGQLKTASGRDPSDLHLHHKHHHHHHHNNHNNNHHHHHNHRDQLHVVDEIYRDGKKHSLEVTTGGLTGGTTTSAGNSDSGATRTTTTTSSNNAIPLEHDHLSKMGGTSGQLAQHHHQALSSGHQQAGMTMGADRDRKPGDQYRNNLMLVGEQSSPHQQQQQQQQQQASSATDKRNLLGSDSKQQQQQQQRPIQQPQQLINTRIGPNTAGAGRDLELGRYATGAEDEDEIQSAGSGSRSSSPSFESDDDSPVGGASYSGIPAPSAARTPRSMTGFGKKKQQQQKQPQQQSRALIAQFRARKATHDQIGDQHKAVQNQDTATSPGQESAGRGARGLFSKSSNAGSATGSGARRALRAPSAAKAPPVAMRRAQTAVGAKNFGASAVAAAAAAAASNSDNNNNNNSACRQSKQQQQARLHQQPLIPRSPIISRNEFRDFMMPTGSNPSAQTQVASNNSTPVGLTTSTAQKSTTTQTTKTGVAECKLEQVQQEKPNFGDDDNNNNDNKQLAKMDPNGNNKEQNSNDSAISSARAPVGSDPKQTQERCETGLIMSLAACNNKTGTQKHRQQQHPIQTYTCPCGQVISHNEFLRCSEPQRAKQQPRRRKSSALIASSMEENQLRPGNRSSGAMNAGLDAASTQSGETSRAHSMVSLEADQDLSSAFGAAAAAAAAAAGEKHCRMHGGGGKLKLDSLAGSYDEASGSLIGASGSTSTTVDDEDFSTTRRSYCQACCSMCSSLMSDEDSLGNEDEQEDEEGEENDDDDYTEDNLFPGPGVEEASGEENLGVLEPKKRRMRRKSYAGQINGEQQQQQQQRLLSRCRLDSVGQQKRRLTGGSSQTETRHSRSMVTLATADMNSSERPEPNLGQANRDGNKMEANLSWRKDTKVGLSQSGPRSGESGMRSGSIENVNNNKGPGMSDKSEQRETDNNNNNNNISSSSNPWGDWSQKSATKLDPTTQAPCNGPAMGTGNSGDRGTQSKPDPCGPDDFRPRDSSWQHQQSSRVSTDDLSKCTDGGGLMVASLLASAGLKTVSQAASLSAIKTKLKSAAGELLVGGALKAAPSTLSNASGQGGEQTTRVQVQTTPIQHQDQPQSGQPAQAIDLGHSAHLHQRHQGSGQPATNQSVSWTSPLGRSGGMMTRSRVGQRHKSKSENRARKALRTISFILGAFVLCWTPYHILALVAGFCSKPEGCVNTHLFYFTYFLCYTNSPINPFCYALANAQFKRAFYRVLRCNFGGVWQQKSLVIK